jgi:hypothetical protein
MIGPALLTGYSSHETYPCSPTLILFSKFTKANSTSFVSHVKSTAQFISFRSC